MQHRNEPGTSRSFLTNDLNKSDDMRQRPNFQNFICFSVSHALAVAAESLRTEQQPSRITDGDAIRKVIVEGTWDRPWYVSDDLFWNLIGSNRLCLSLRIRHADTYAPFLPLSLSRPNYGRHKNFELLGILQRFAWILSQPSDKIMI